MIDVSVLKRCVRTVPENLITPAEEDTNYELIKEQTSEPIKKIDDINNICSFLKEHHRYRDYMMFVLGINFGLRISDLKEIRFAHIINEDLTFKNKFPVFEKKTRNTRKKKVNRYITINDAVVEAVITYLENNPGVSLSDYMFTSNSNNGKGKNTPLSTRSVNRILTEIKNTLSLDVKMSTHTLRKTFCYHQMVMSNNDPRKLMLLQKMLNHSSPMQTLAYIGITSEEIEEAYNNLNLGSEKYNYVSGCNIVEDVDTKAKRVI